ncbi:MAG TPA: DUF3857 domain-containing protein [Bryobacteraceae bacterium]|nr:DUF3857 domain-containing protein [Bryobacteraceae bacterium]
MRRLFPRASGLALTLICVSMTTEAFSQEMGPQQLPDYSKEGVVVEHFSKEITFAANGSWEAEQTATVRVQSDAGVQQLGVLSFGYDRDNQKVEIAYVRVRKPEGGLVVTPEDNVQDVSSEITRAAPTYSDLREKQIPVKALSVGDVLEYKIRFIQSKPDIPGQFWYSQNFIADGVVLDESLEISVPGDKYVKVVSPNLKPEVHEAQGRKIYLWRTAQLEPTSQQSDRPKKKKQDSQTVSVQLTTFKTWDELGHWYGNLANARGGVTPAIQAKADELTKGLSNEMEKERAVYDFVSTRFHYVSISFGVGRYQPHPADEVLANQYGDCKDKHTLFAALLKAAGIKAWPALIGSGIKLDDSVPSPAQFNHLITVIPQGKEYVWLDTTPEVAPYGLLQPTLRDKEALIIPDDGEPALVKTPANPPFAGSQLIDVQATLNEEGTLTGHFEMSTHGDEEVIVRSAFHSVPPAKWRDLVQVMVNALGFLGTVSNVDVDSPTGLDKPFHYSFDYKRPNYSDWENHRVSPPLFPILLAPGENAAEPAEPSFFGAPGDIRFCATIQLPKNYSVQVPEGKMLHSDFADYSGSYSVEKGVLTADRHLAIKQAYIPVKAWNEYKAFAKAVAADHDQLIQLQALGAKEKTEPGNSEAGTLVSLAIQAGQRQDYNAARDYLARAEHLNPRQSGLWLGYGSLYFVTNEPEKAYEALRKEIQFHPDNIAAYRVLAQGQDFHHKRDEAIETLRTLLKVVPDDLQGIASLSALLIATRHYGEVPNLIQPVLAKGDNDFLHGLLVEALLRSGRKDEGLAAAQKYVKGGDGMKLNDAAYYLADTNTELPLAQQYAESAVSKLEEQAEKLTLSSISDADLAIVNSLAAAWDTLGWVYFRSGDLAKAEKYLGASWRLSQGGAAGLHLGETYDRQGKRQAAIHAWQLALASNGLLDEARERLRQAGAPANPGPKRKPGAKVWDSVSPGEELGKLRTTPIPALPKQKGSAEFFLLFSRQKLEDVQFINGSESLKSAASALKTASYDVVLPDAGAEKIIRRGILSCSSYTAPSCQFTMLLPATTRR